VEFERQEGREAYHRSPPDRGDVALKAPNMLEVVNLNRRFSWGEAIDKYSMSKRCSGPPIRGLNMCQGPSGLSGAT
jgi:hypothetical protein